MGKGINFAIFIKTGEDSETNEDIMTKLAGQRGGTLNRSRSNITNTSKDSGGWAENDYGIGEWSIDGDGVLVESDEAYLALEDAFMNEEKVVVYWQTAAGHKYKGNAVITDFPQEGPYDAEATYSVSLMGDGAPQKVTAE